MTTYEGILDDGGGHSFRLYVDPADGSYIDVPRDDEIGRTALDVPHDVPRWRIDIRDDSASSVKKLTGDEWKPLFEAADDASRETPLQNLLVTYRGGVCPLLTNTTSFRSCC